MTAGEEQFAAAGSEGVHVLAGGIVMLLAFLPVVRCASQLAPAGSSSVLIATLIFESALCLVMLLDKIRWREAWPRRQRALARAAAARSRRVEEVALDFFLSEIVYYPSWIRHSRGHVPARITEAVKLAAGATRLSISGAEYLFTFRRELTPGENDRGKLDLSVDGSVVLSVSAAISGDPGATHTSGHQVSAFVEGPWVRELLALSAEAQECHRAQARLRREMERN